MAVNYENIATDLTNKANKNLSNVPASKSILVESYKNGSSFYRVYSDGWCVQGGALGVVATASYQTVTLLKPYPDTDYNIQITGNVAGAAYATTASIYHWQAAYKTEADFQIWQHTAATLGPKCWMAFGYLS